MIVQTVPARTALVKLVTAASPEALETALGAFLAAQGEAVLLGMQYEAPSPTLYTVLVVYTR